MNNDIDIKEIYKEMELELISSMKRNLSKHLKEENKVEFKFTQWQAETLKEMKRFQRENKDIIGKYTEPINNSISKQLKNELKQGSKKEFKRYKSIMKDKFNSSDNLKHSFFNLNDDKIINLIKETKENTRTANAACFRMMNDKYRKTISKAVMFSNNGVISPKQAIDMATKDFLSAGINCIEYKDGRRVNIADYCDMAVRTANTRAQLIGEGQFREELGEHLVKPTRHNTSCEKCSKWEGRILIDDVYSGGSKKDGKYPLLSEAMADGFLHPRCRHGLPTYYKELDDMEFDDNGPTEETSRGYREDVNWINNNIQKYERLIVGSFDSKNILFYEQKKEEWEERKKLQDVIIETRNTISPTFQERTKGVKIKIHNENYSRIDLEKNKIYLGKKSNKYDLIHELAHKLQDNFTDEEQIVYNKIVSNKFKNYKRNDFKTKNGTEKYYILKDNSNFVSEYQTRVYAGGFINDILDVDYALEYFSEGVMYFYKDPKLLKEKDLLLYKFIEKVVGK